MPKILLIATLAGAGLTIITGCARSDQEITTGGASGPGKPGFVRLLNLSPDDASMVDRGRQIVPPVSTNEASSFTTFPSGERTLLIRGKLPDLPLKMHLNPGSSRLIVLGANGRTSTTFEDPRTPEKGHNLKLIYLDSDGSVRSVGPSVTLANSGSHVVLSAKTPATTLPNGGWNVSANHLPKSVSLTVALNTTYDLVLVKGSNGRYFEIILGHLFVEKAKVASAGKMNLSLLQHSYAKPESMRRH